jgi:uncharacterized protein YunC (DUF1805 family)
MELIAKTYPMKKGLIQGYQLKWETSWLFLLEAGKGTITCGSFDIAAFGTPAAKAVPQPGKPAYTLDDFVQRPVTHVNPAGEQLGIRTGMTTLEAAEKLL